MSAGACDGCLARTWLLARLAGHIELHRDRTQELLTLSDADLLAAVGGQSRPEIEFELSSFEPSAARERAARAGVTQICRCDERYPAALNDLAAPPAVIHLAGTPDRLRAQIAEPTVAIVGSRRPSTYGTDVAYTLARGAASAGITVISGMAAGIDSGAHIGALEAGGQTLAVLACAPERAYPPRAYRLHARIMGTGAVVSELPPATQPRRWMFPARNRLIAALAQLTVVVEARSRSGALLTARAAAELQRSVGAVPGRITSPLADGPHELLRNGAVLVRRPEDLLDALLGPGRADRRPARPRLAPDAEALLDALSAGHETWAALAQAGIETEPGLALLASLELTGLIRREPGGSYAVRP